MSELEYDGITGRDRASTLLWSLLLTVLIQAQLGSKMGRTAGFSRVCTTSISTHLPLETSGDLLQVRCDPLPLDYVAVLQLCGSGSS